MTAPTPSWWPTVRDGVLLVAGLALLWWEVMVLPEPRPLIVTLAAGMIGLPATLITGRTLLGGPAPPPRTPPSDTPEAARSDRT